MTCYLRCHNGLQIIKTATVPASACKRANTLQFHDSKIKFPLTHRYDVTSMVAMLPWQRRWQQQ
jgi:hypothetical protein